MRWFLVAGTASLGILFGCGNSDEDISKLDASDYMPPGGFATLTIANDGVTIEPELVDDTGLWLTMVNESDEVTSVSIRFHGQDVEPLEFGLAPGETRLESVGDASAVGGVRLEWEDGVLHVYQRDLEPTPTPFYYAAQTSGCLFGYRSAQVWDRYAADPLNLEFEDEFPIYALGYPDGHFEGLSDGHSGRPEEIADELDHENEIFYVRGYRDGYADGYLAATDSEVSQTYRDEYFEGFIRGYFGDEEHQCESLEATPAN